MGIWSRRLGSGTIAIFLTGSSAWADVTAEQVWTDFKTYLEAFGYSVNGNEQASSGTVTITDLTLNMDEDASGTAASIAMDNISFTETGDGRVRVALPETMPLTFTARPPEEGAEEVQGVVEYSQSGFEMIVSGAPEDMQYDYGAAEMAFALSSLIVDGEPVEIEQARMSMSDIAGRSNMSGSDLRVTAQTMTATALNYVVDIANPDDPSGRVAITGGLSDLGFEGEARLPADVASTRDFEGWWKREHRSHPKLLNLRREDLLDSGDAEPGVIPTRPAIPNSRSQDRARMSRATAVRMQAT